MLSATVEPLPRASDEAMLPVRPFTALTWMLMAALVAIAGLYAGHYLRWGGSRTMTAHSPSPRNMSCMVSCRIAISTTSIRVA